MSLADNLARVREHISDACAQAGRSPDDIHILAVTKRHPVDVLAQALALGLTELAENRVQEALPKLDALPGARIHLIGPLQANKVNKATGRFASIAAVDGGALLERIDRRARELGVVQDIWIQVNATAEAQKHGVAPQHAAALWTSALGLAGVRPRGVMAMSRFGAAEAEVRSTFAAVRGLVAGWVDRDGAPPALSMGMSDDYPWAILEGATHLRLGTVLFGERSG